MSQNSALLLTQDDPLRNHPLYRTPPLTGAEDLELTVRSAVARWTEARLAAETRSGTIEHPDWLIRQLLCTTTTVNLATSPVEYRRLRPAELFAPPLTFWLNSEALLDLLEIPAEFVLPEMAGKHYLRCVDRYDFALVEGDFVHEGDSFFSFAVPEPAFEDLDLIVQLTTGNLITPRFAACVLMMDFANPLYSPRRAALLEHCPTTTATTPAADGGLSDVIADAIVAAARDLPANSPEHEFAANWTLHEIAWRDEFASRIEMYMTVVHRLATQPDRVDDYVRLAEPRRREFRATKLAEVTLTLPHTSIPADAALLEMQPDGTVRPK
ncbi:hypothetical protein [Rhodococcus sp. MTM3W5.2]|uniref:hypothetical protein n=1 Tax=Rhodococcus sp. MTM3W5.2 TaxID=1805827 RepID=UPI00097C6465|nr:hypothetical protein [Rhodococcus sp. MTM3W5.2]